MKKLIIFLGLLILCISISPLSAQERSYHGGDAVFSVDDIAVFWAVLKGEDLESSRVYINIVPFDINTSEYTKYSVIAANVFSGEERILVDYQDLEEDTLIIQDYGDFNKLSKRRLLFFNAEDGRNNPAMEIYYAGMPDTAPVFMDDSKIKSFFEHSERTMKKKTAAE